MVGSVGMGGLTGEWHFESGGKSWSDLRKGDVFTVHYEGFGTETKKVISVGKGGKMKAEHISGIVPPKCTLCARLVG